MRVSGADHYTQRVFVVCRVLNAETDFVNAWPKPWGMEILEPLPPKPLASQDDAVLKGRLLR